MQNKKTNNKLQTYDLFIRIIIFKTEDCSFPYFLLSCQLLLVPFGFQGGTPEVLASACDLGDRRQAPTRTLLYNTGPLPFETNPRNKTIIKIIHVMFTTRSSYHYLCYIKTKLCYIKM